MTAVNLQTTFSSKDRDVHLERLKSTYFELLIIGGGATGCGIALDAASRGIKTALIEKDDFASGTSSKSTKLIHGGLRYLKQLDLRLVRESGTERAVVNRLAPHLVLPEKMLLPLIKGGTFGKWSTSFGLWLYDMLAKVRRGDKRRMLSRKETLETEPLLDRDKVIGAGYYAEYRTDDARLTIELIKKANQFGAHALNYCKAVDFLYEDGSINGVRCLDTLSGESFDVKARVVISAAGPWVDELRKLNHSIGERRLHLTKGVHIVFPFEKVPVSQSVYFDAPDGRMVFAIPRGKVTYVGTTDTNYKGDLDRVVVTEEDRDYLIGALLTIFPGLKVTRNDVVSNWAGLRPLIHQEGKSPSELSRRDEIFLADDGLISIAGGKLTGYRKMAERVTDKAVHRLQEVLNRQFPESTTSEIPLCKRCIGTNEDVEDYIKEVKSRVVKMGLEESTGWYLVTNYGSQSEDILKSMTQFRRSPEVSLALAEAGFAIKHEMIQTLADFFVRRTGNLYFDIGRVHQMLEPVGQFIRESLEWPDQRFREEMDLMQQYIHDATHYYKTDLI